MSIPIGASWIYEGPTRRKAGVRLASGDRVTRSEGERMGARESGYKNPHQERKALPDRKAFLHGDKFGRYREFYGRAMKKAQSDGKRVDRRAVETAYWRAHTAGENFRASRKGTSEAREAQRELQRALAALSKFTGGDTVNVKYGKGYGTP